MAKTVRLTLRLEEDTKRECESILNELGLSIATGMNMFAKAVIRHRGLPFEVVQEETGPFFGPFNLKQIEKSRKQLANGEGFIVTAEELGLDEED